MLRKDIDGLIEREKLQVGDILELIIISNPKTLSDGTRGYPPLVSGFWKKLVYLQDWTYLTNFLTARIKDLQLAIADTAILPSDIESYYEKFPKNGWENYSNVFSLKEDIFSFRKVGSLDQTIPLEEQPTMTLEEIEEEIREKEIIIGNPIEITSPLQISGGCNHGKFAGVRRDLGYLKRVSYQTDPHTAKKTSICLQVEYNAALPGQTFFYKNSSNSVEHYVNQLETLAINKLDSTVEVPLNEYLSQCARIAREMSFEFKDLKCRR